MAGNPNFDKVVLQLHCNVATGFTDVSLTPKTVTATNAVISTAQSKLGGASAYFDGTGDILAVTPLTDFAFGTGDFSIEMFIRLSSFTGANFFDMRPNSTSNGAYPLIYCTPSTIRFFVSSADKITSGTLSTNTWYHLAVGRTGTNTKMFIDGVQAGSTFTSDTTNYAAGSVTFGGSSNNAGNFTGYFDEIRIYKGYNPYPSAFTAPTAEFSDALPIVSGVVRDSSNALCARTVRAYDRTTGALVASTTSNGTTGAYTLNCTTLNEVSVLCLDDVAGTTENDLVLRTTPV